MERRNMFFATCVLCVCVCTKTTPVHTYSTERWYPTGRGTYPPAVTVHVYMDICMYNKYTHTHTHDTTLSDGRYSSDRFSVSGYI
jgi:hypothetical protein